MSVRIDAGPAVVAWLQLVRAPAVFSALSNILAAQLVVGNGRIDWAVLPVLAIISACLYVAGMVLNDCFDLAEDLRERPDRPLPSGRISKRAAWLVGCSLLLVANLAGLGLGGLQFAIVFGLTILILLYDGVAKGSLLGPFVMGGCRYLNWILGLSTAGLLLIDWLLPLPVLLYIVGLTFLSRAEVGGDVGRFVIPAVLSLCGAVVMTLLLAYLGSLAQVEMLALFLAFGAWLVIRLLKLKRANQPAAVQSLVSLMIFGIIPLDALLASAAGPWWAGLLVLALLLPARVLGRTLYVT